MGESGNKSSLDMPNLLLDAVIENSTGQIGDIPYSFDSQINFEIECNTDLSRPRIPHNRVIL